MRKTNDGLQGLTSLEKAEKRLEEAIEFAKQQSNIKNSESSKANKAVEDALTEFKKIAIEEKGKLTDKESMEIDVEERKNAEIQGAKGVKTLYGYAPEFSSNKKIENNMAEIEGQKKVLLESILDKDVVSKVEESLVRKNLLDEEFHDGYNSINEIASFNKAMRLRSKQSPEMDILNKSQIYEMNCFNKRNVFDGDTYEPEDIMPSDFLFHSFDDEDEGDVKPYDINKALILGDDITQDGVVEENENMSGVQKLPIEQNTLEFDQEKLELLEQVQQQAEEILGNARIEAQKITEAAQQKAQIIIDEQVKQAMEDALKQGYDEGFKQGQNEGYLAAEDAVNDGMRQEAEVFRHELELSIQEFNTSKDEILDNNLNELTDLAINVAEKVIKISLKSSKDVVAKMIIAAAEDCRNKEWAKVYISHEDKSIAMNLEKDLIDALNQISANVKVVVMEDEPSGTCIIESPDQIVDASVESQLNNVRQIVSDNKR